MTKRRIITVSVASAIVLLGLVFWFARSFDSRKRIEREHGVRLPSSASAFEFRGDAWRGFLDRGASSAFIVRSNELGGFLTQLSVRTNLQTFIPGDTQYELHSAWRRGKPAMTYSCSSSVGDWLHVEVWPIDDDRVGVCLYTDWN